MEQEAQEPGIEAFYRFCSQGRIMGLRCEKGHIRVPPKRICPRCGSPKSEWVPLSGKGELLSYTVVYSAPKQFEKYVPYILGLVKLDEGPRLLAMVRDVAVDEVWPNMKLQVDFEPGQTGNWPGWPKILFKPIKP